MQVIFLFRKFKNSILKIPKLPQKIKEFINVIFDNRLKKIINIKDKENDKILKIFDFGVLTRYRANTFY